MSIKRAALTVLCAGSLLLNAGLCAFILKDDGARSRLKALYSKKEAPAIKAEPVCYRFSFADIAEVPMEAAKQGIMELPESLIISPGVYTIAGKTADMRQEGLYRVMMPFKQNYQVAVYQNSLDTLLSSLSWAVTHGNSDNKLPIEKLEKKAQHDKLYLTCGYVTPFARKLLTDLGYKTRTINMATLGAKNGYDDAHVMMEVFHPIEKRWILVDLDNNVLFEDSTSTHKLLDLAGTKISIDSGTINYRYLSSDVTTDVSGFKDKSGYSFGFYTEALNTEASRTHWYKRIMGDITIVH